jgi:hypothetical protein
VPGPAAGLEAEPLLLAGAHGPLAEGADDGAQRGLALLELHLGPGARRSISARAHAQCASQGRPSISGHQAAGPCCPQQACAGLWPRLAPTRTAGHPLLQPETFARVNTNHRGACLDTACPNSPKTHSGGQTGLGQAALTQLVPTRPEFPSSSYGCATLA